MEVTEYSAYGMADFISRNTFSVSQEGNGDDADVGVNVGVLTGVFVAAGMMVGVSGGWVGVGDIEKIVQPAPTKHIPRAKKVVPTRNVIARSYPDSNIKHCR